MRAAETARSAPVRHIGLDFDNTLISYDHVFASYAAAEGIVLDGQTSSKVMVREAVRALPNGELRWQALQGRVYGKGIAEAVPLEGASEFIRRCRASGCEVDLISHKTQYGHFDPDRVNLRHVALAWLADHDFLDESNGLRADRVDWEATRDAKIRRILTRGCTLFVDDLEEVLSDERFPEGVERILLSAAPKDACRPYVTCRTWAEVASHVFG